MIGQRRCISFRRNHLITAKDRRTGQSANVLRDAEQHDEADKVRRALAEHAQESVGERGTDEKRGPKGDQSLTPVKLWRARDACCIAIDPRTERNNQRGHHDLIRQTPLRKRQAGRTGAQNHGESDDREQRTELVVGETAGSQEPDGAVGLFGER